MYASVVHSEKHKISSEALPRLTANVLIELFHTRMASLSMLFSSTTTISISQHTQLLLAQSDLTGFHLPELTIPRWAVKCLGLYNRLSASGAVINDQCQSSYLDSITARFGRTTLHTRKSMVCVIYESVPELKALL
jgi:hypothetical protein